MSFRDWDMTPPQIDAKRRELLKKAPAKVISTALLPQAYDPAFTHFASRFNSSGKAGGIPQRTGPMRTAAVPFALTANAPAIVIAIQDPFRKGMLLQNLDPVTALFVGFGTLADANQFQLVANQTLLFDFVCPTDFISVFATANVRGYLATFSQIAE